MQPRGTEYNVVRRFGANDQKFDRASNPTCMDREANRSHYYFGGAVEACQGSGGWFPVVEVNSHFFEGPTKDDVNRTIRIDEYLCDIVFIDSKDDEERVVVRNVDSEGIVY